MAQYATIQQLKRLGLPAEALTDLTGEQLCEFLVNAGDLIDTYLTQQHTLPLKGSLTDATDPFPGSIVRCNLIIAAYDVLTHRGYNPDQEDTNWRLRFEDCIDWLGMLAKGAVSLGPNPDATAVREGAPKVHSEGTPKVHSAVVVNEKRGW